MDYRDIERLQDIQTDIDEHISDIVDIDLMVAELEKKKSAIIKRLRKDRDKLEHEVNRDGVKDSITDEFLQSINSSIDNCNNLIG